MEYKQTAEKARSQNQGDPVIVTGSLYLLGELKQRMNQ